MATRPHISPISHHRPDEKPRNGSTVQGFFFNNPEFDRIVRVRMQAVRIILQSHAGDRSPAAVSAEGNALSRRSP